MIVVIADDLTGAAELAGIGLRYNLLTELSFGTCPSDITELFVVATNTRSGNEDDAVREITRVTQEVIALNPDFVYKKVDSVLRGHIVAELKAQLELFQIERAIIVAPNPLLGRTIRNGKYYIKDQPIHLSSFATDPEFAIGNSDVVEMIHSDRSNVCVKKPGEDLPAKGIIIAEVEKVEDYKIWNRKEPIQTLYGGGAGFFDASLGALGLHPERPLAFDKYTPGGTELFVCGSAFLSSQQLVKKVKDNGGPVCYLPMDGNSGEWMKEMLDFLKKGKAILAIDPANQGGGADEAIRFRQQTADLVEIILQEVHVSELFIEGGSTAGAILNKLQRISIFPVQEFAQGVVRMKVKNDNSHITVKPGSYTWPEGVWQF